jgi:uncharacterized protein YjbI with pentapeptide repeats
MKIPLKNWNSVFVCSLVVFAGIAAIDQLNAQSEELIGGAINRDVVARNVERLLKTRECPNCDLRGMVLSREVVADHPLSHNYNWVPPVKDSLGRLDIDGGVKKPIVVNLRGANLEGATLIGIDLGFADLKDSNLTRTRIEETFLYKADFRGANFKGATIRNSVLTCSNFQNARNFSGFNKSDFSKELPYFYNALSRINGESITGFSTSMACLAKLPSGNLYTDDCKDISLIKELTNSCLSNH